MEFGPLSDKSLIHSKVTSDYLLCTNNKFFANHTGWTATYNKFYVALLWCYLFFTLYCFSWLSQDKITVTTTVFIIHAQATKILRIYWFLVSAGQILLIASIYSRGLSLNRKRNWYWKWLKSVTYKQILIFLNLLPKDIQIWYHPVAPHCGRRLRFVQMCLHIMVERCLILFLK